MPAKVFWHIATLSFFLKIKQTQKNDKKKTQKESFANWTCLQQSNEVLTKPLHCS